MGSRFWASASGEDMQPGKISRELREALELPENDLPIWIYRMRALGYPPGWLKKAVVENDDIFDCDSSDEGADKADANQRNSKKRKRPDDEQQVQYDSSKLIEYPGFNVPMPDECVDYHYYVNMPAMLEHQQLEYAKKHMVAFQPAPLPKRSRVDEPKQPVPETIPLESSSAQEPEDESSIKLLSTPSSTKKNVERVKFERFSEGVVGELLYFENLPNSTGRFDNIRGIIKSFKNTAQTP